jgi:hypothetical protein
MADYTAVTEELLEEFVRPLKLFPEIRSDEHIDKIYEIIADYPFVQQLGSNIMRKQLGC